MNIKTVANFQTVIIKYNKNKNPKKREKNLASGTFVRFRQFIEIYCKT